MSIDDNNNNTTTAAERRAYERHAQACRREVARLRHSVWGVHEDVLEEVATGYQPAPTTLVEDDEMWRESMIRLSSREIRETEGLDRAIRASRMARLEEVFSLEEKHASERKAKLEAEKLASRVESKAEPKDQSMVGFFPTWAVLQTLGFFGTLDNAVGRPLVAPLARVSTWGKALKVEVRVKKGMGWLLENKILPAAGCKGQKVKNGVLSFFIQHQQLREVRQLLVARQGKAPKSYKDKVQTKAAIESLLAKGWDPDEGSQVVDNNAPEWWELAFLRREHLDYQAPSKDHRLSALSWEAYYNQL